MAYYQNQRFLKLRHLQHSLHLNRRLPLNHLRKQLRLHHHLKLWC